MGDVARSRDSPGGCRVSEPVAQDASLGRLLGLIEAHNPNLIDIVRADTEDDFVRATEGVLARVIGTIEGRRETVLATG